MVYGNIIVTNFMKEKMHTLFEVIVLINCDCSKAKSKVSNAYCQ